MTETTTRREPVVLSEDEAVWLFEFYAMYEARPDCTGPIRDAMDKMYAAAIRQQHRRRDARRRADAALERQEEAQ